MKTPLVKPKDLNNQLIFSVRKGQLEVVKALLEAGADVDATDNLGRTTLICAVVNQHVEVVKLLLERGADVGVTDRTGRTALKLAADYGHSEIVNILNNYPVFLQSCGYFKQNSLELNLNHVVILNRIA